MWSRDRTQDFFAVVERLQSQLGGGDGLGRPLLAVPGPPAAGASEFTRRAARVGHGIHATSAKLARLAQLARRTSVFEDPSAEIAELTAVVKADITALNAALTELQSQAGTRGGSDNQSGAHSATVVDTLKSRLMGATREFRDVLTARQEAIKVHHNRRGLFSSLPDADALGPPRRPGPGSLHVSPGGLPTHARLGGGLQQQLVLAPQDTYLASRAEALQQVERTIAELGGIFQQLASMVAEQGELAIRIDENLDDTITNVESAQQQLARYLSRVSGNRGLVLKIFGILMRVAGGWGVRGGGPRARELVALSVASHTPPAQPVCDPVCHRSRLIGRLRRPAAAAAVAAAWRDPGAAFVWSFSPIG